jgi:flagellar biogenesis protein FliO
MDAAQEAWLLLRGLAALLAVLALAVVVLRFGLPRLMRPAAGRTRTIEVEEFLPLDRQHRLYVVRWRGERILLATSPEGVALLSRVSAADEDGAGGQA